ncbi:ImmA/IrrE family metallo-endopeptidase [Pontibacter sp. Tf4]|uniref:ImmA/IrrE family metallo-endopeptidase n=1 Tax=Pontibacter sp. Tf4 TaxID=2761620 RepID=UPI0016293C24|nr:ImmA/IrrE family metallo-endopeptidase [Pontibacter sp. Tf4]MBB6611788.1 ImmA/IrrE family metallo-endopeptidase [Pontibacter sp. Tf4]
MKRIENQVNELLTDLKITQAPVPVRKIAKALGLSIKAYDLGDGVSGALLLDNDKAIIGVNPSESRERTRFTIAHEIGHYSLHKSSSALFVDKDGLIQKIEEDGVRVLFRDGKSSSGEVKIEREANAFAAALLMPVNLLKKEINSLDLDNYKHDEEIINELARRFKVSTIAMTYRLTNLGVLQ